VLFLKLVTFEQAVGAVDFNVIFLLVGMMASAYILSKTGFFEWISISVAKDAKGDPVRIMMTLAVVTAVLSAFLDNVTTVVMMVPVTILIAQLLEISPVPFVIMEVIASNIGGTATLIGDPPNMLIGSQAGLSFNDFLMNLAPVTVIVLIAFVVTATFWFRKKLVVNGNVRSKVIESDPELAIVEKGNMVKALIVMGVMLVGFVFHGVLGVEPGIIALGGGMLMLLVCGAESEETLMKVEWSVIFFFVGMFMMISALNVNGAIDWFGHKVLNFSGNNLFAVAIIVLLGSALITSIMDNIPFIIVSVPVIKQFVDHFATSLGLVDPSVINMKVAEPLWWALALGTCLGGNGTLIGASVNIVAARISEKNGYPISFLKFTKYGSVFTIQAMLICTVYLWARYFR
jgi:Na+/H+ antiporter NhaD/arsenite permease-like protein